LAADAVRVMTDGRKDFPTSEKVLEVILDQNPDALITANADTGQFIPVPDTIALTDGQRTIEGSTAVGLVVPEDVPKVVEGWREVHAAGRSRRTVRLKDDPEQDVILQFLDVREKHGVWVTLILGYQNAALPGDGAALVAPMLRPRVVHAKRDTNAVMLEVEPAVQRMLGWGTAEMVGKTTLAFLDEADHRRAIESWLDMLASPGQPRRLRLRHKCKDGSSLWVELTNENRLDDPDVKAVLVEILDISDEMRVHEALAANEQLLRRLTETLPLGVLQLDRDRGLVYQNARLARILGRPLETIGDLLGKIAEEDEPRLRRAIDGVLRRGKDGDLEIGLRRRRRRDAHRCDVRLRALTTDIGEVTGALLCVVDVTNDVRLREELRHRATFDPLTGCYNRAAILDLLAQKLALDADECDGVAVVFVDLDHFKKVNDRYGHAAGDELLRAASGRLLGGLRGDDLIGRLGGDEFLVVCSDVTGPQQALRIAERALAEIRSAPVDVGEAQILPAASIGVAWAGRGSKETPEALIARADAAMYRAKSTRDGQPVLARRGRDRLAG
jgi:diguanylate cyclase (GGDEF)-like protein/PAS domain S-box-containing protein